jgi:hypothetical protein
MRMAIRLVRAALFLGIVVLIPLALTGFWVRQEIYSQDQYVSTVSRLAGDPAIQSEISNRILTTIETQIQQADLPAADLQSIETMYAQLRPTIERELAAFMASSTFQGLWADLNRQLHPYLKALLTGQNFGPLESSGGNIRLDLLPIYHSVNQQLHTAGIDLLDRLPSQPTNLELVLYDGERLREAQETVQLLNDTIVVAAILIAIFAILFVVLARNRLRALYWLAIGSGVSFLLLLLVLWAGNRATVNALSDMTSRATATSFYEAVIETLISWTQVGIVAAILVTAGFALFALFGNREAQQQAI